MFKVQKYVLVLFVILLIVSISPSSAVSLGEVQKDAGKLKNDADALKSNMGKWTESSVLTKLKLTKQLIKNMNILRKDFKKFNSDLTSLDADFNKESSSIVKSGPNNVNEDADHIVSELQKQYNIIVTKESVAVGDLNAGFIVQTINNNGYIRYLVYHGFVDHNGTQVVELLAGNCTIVNLSIEDFNKEYTGIAFLPVSNPKDSRL